MFLHGKWPIYVHMYIWFTYQTLICSLAMAIFRNWRWVLWLQRREVSAPLFFKGATVGSYTGPCTLFLKCQAETFSPWRALTFTDSCCLAFSGGRTIEKLWNIQTPQFFWSLNEVILLVPVFCWGDYRDYHDPSSVIMGIALNQQNGQTFLTSPESRPWWKSQADTDSGEL